ncbi:MAG: hypothetical protein IKH99_02120 [Prevotella sp.]|nr:hypothetical protein [Prevotella sp.]
MKKENRIVYVRPQIRCLRVSENVSLMAASSGGAKISGLGDGGDLSEGWE